MTISGGVRNRLNHFIEDWITKVGPARIGLVAPNACFYPNETCDIRQILNEKTRVRYVNSGLIVLDL